MQNPTVFPTQYILTISLICTVAYMLLFFAYASFKKKHALKDRLLPGDEDRGSTFLVIWLLAVALIVRIAVSVLVVGHKTDINCFTAWGYNIVTRGFKSFYNPSSGMPDYPPGYMYILGLMSKLSLALGHGIRDASGAYDLWYVTIVKLPSIIADLAASYLVFRLARRRLAFAPAYILTAIVAFCPVMIYISSGWGQIDQILAVLIALAIYALMSDKAILAGFLYGLAILMKPQALMAGPLMALAYVFYVFDPNFFKDTGRECKDSKGVRLLKTAIAVSIAVVMLVVAAIPFSTAEMPWYKLLIQKYLGTATSYKYASVNAYNIYTLFGHNWTRIDKASALGLTFGQLGTIGMVFSVVFGGVLYAIGRKKSPEGARGALYLAAAYTFISLFTLGHYMHERYLFPALLLLIIAYIYYGDRKLLLMFLGYSTTALINCFAAFYYSKLHDFGLYWDKKIVFGCSLANVILFVLLTLICISIMLAGRKGQDVFIDDAEEKPAVPAGK